MLRFVKASIAFVQLMDDENAVSEIRLMAKNLYALLVGINQYDVRSRVPHLRGCVNDIEGMQSYLEGRVAAPKEKAAALKGQVAANDLDGFELHLQVLTDSQATRQGIIDGFQQHLAQASSGDVVLFYYAGHGAQAKAPEAFWLVSPDRMMETLVCYDSRIDDEHWDLADKELGQLIAELDAKQPHIAVILDCCHSGSGTREVAPNGLEETEQVATRRAEIDYRDRPLESFLLSPADALAMSTQSGAAGTRSLTEVPMTLQLPLGRHVVLSACSNIEEAKEYHGSGIPRGAFSHFLQESLSKANGSLSYRDLFKRTNALIRSGVPAQSPQLEATNSEDLERPFLGGAIAPTPPYFTISYDKDYGWSIDGGAIHGLQPSIGDETTVLAAYPFDADAQQMKNVSQAIARVGITKVFAQLSTIAIRESDSSNPIFADQDNTFKAVVISSPLPPLQVYLQGDETGIEALKSAIATVGPQGSASLYVRTIDQIDGAAFRVLVQDDTCTITSPTDARALATPVRGYNSIAAAKVAQDLEHIARWKTIAELASPASSKIQGAVNLKIYTGEEATPEAAKEIKSSQIRLDYRYDTSRQKWMRPRFRIKLHNTSNQTLYCAFFYLTERFKVDVIKPDGVTSVVRLAPGQEIWFANGRALNGTVADALWQQGITECLDILKLIACTDEFDPTLMILGELGLQPVSRRTRSLASAGGGSLNRLMQRVNTRDIGFDDGEEEVYDDWVANQIGFTFVRPQPSTPVDRAQSAAVGAGVTIRPHSALSANARLTTVPQSTRDLGSFILPPLLQAHTEALQFTQSRASDPGLSAIELNNIRNPEAVTAENPLVIEAEVSLGDDEYVLPIAHDGEFYLPLGYGKKSKTGKTEIVIERLTEPISEGNRSVTGSVRIFFQKIVNKKLGLAFDYPLLAIAQLEQPTQPNVQSTAKKAASPKVTYIREAEAVKARVAEAQNIAIYVHGIFGDTESMLPSLDSAIATLEDSSTPIGELYDLVLAFDYENLNTTIDQNARLLKERLVAVGLQTSHGKTVHIIAHSMGGLVSRWFIEQEGGQEIVSHLIMLGTPNSGSPWPQVQAGVTAGVSFALNGLSLVAAPLKILEGLLKRIETIDVSLDQMEPGSDFLAEMAKAPDPGIPYTLVVGNTSLITAEAETLKEKIMQRLGKLVELPFFKQPNDIAVSVNSIVSVPEGRSPAPKQLPTACNHLEYFVHPAGLASLTEAVVGTGIRSSRVSNSNRGGREPALAPDQSSPEPSEPSEPSAPSDPFAQGEPTQTMTEGDEATRSSSKLWIFGIVGLLIAVGIIFGLTQKPASTPTVPESIPESTE